jgi:hypothetical protein
VEPDRLAACLHGTVDRQASSAAELPAPGQPRRQRAGCSTAYGAAARISGKGGSGRSLARGAWQF